MTQKPGNTTTRRQTPVIAVALLILNCSATAQNNLPNASAMLTPRRGNRLVLVSFADRRPAVLEGDKVLAYFTVAVGAAVSPSPTGEFEIVNRVANPAYYHAGEVMSASGNSPIGTRWLGLNLKGYGIHGTNAPRSIGQAASHGCIRLKNRDVERLYSMLRVGDVVKIRGEPDDETAGVFGGALRAPAEETTQTSGQ